MNDVEKDFSVIYSKYIDGLGALVKLPEDIKNMLDIAAKDQSVAEAELIKETSVVNTKFAKLKTSAEEDYTKIWQEMSGMDIPIPARQRPSGTQSNISSIQAFDNQKKIGESIRSIIAQIKNKYRLAEDESRKTALALEERKRLAQKRLEREEQEREKARQEAEQRRILEEKQRFEAERKAAEAKALLKKRLLILGSIGILLLILILFLR